MSEADASDGEVVVIEELDVLKRACCIGRNG